MKPAPDRPNTEHVPEPYLCRECPGALLLKNDPVEGYILFECGICHLRYEAKHDPSIGFWKPEYPKP